MLKHNKHCLTSHQQATKPPATGHAWDSLVSPHWERYSFRVDLWFGGLLQFGVPGQKQGGNFLNFFGAWGGDSYQEFWDGEDESMSDADWRNMWKMTKMSRGSSYEGTFAHVGSLLDTCKHCRKASSGNWWCSLLRKTQLMGFDIFTFWLEHGMKCLTCARV